MKLVLALFGLLLLIVIVETYSKNLLFPTLNLGGTTPTVTIDKQTFNVDIAKTEKDQEIGLSGRDSLDQNKGMLFVFDPATNPTFWMKNMQFPLDIIFITKGKIVNEFTNLQPPASGTPDEQIEKYNAGKNIDRVLEINAGLINKYNFKTGDSVTYSGI